MSHAKSILIVEDEPAILEPLADLLRFEGFAVSTTTNGEEALALLGRLDQAPDLILLDLFMPVMDGMTFLKQLSAREASDWSKIPIIIISAATNLPKLEGQIVEVIKKPLNVDLILQAVQRSAA